MMIDSSVWIDYLYHNQHPDICDYLDRYLQGEKPIYCTPIAKLFPLKVVSV
jgi:hypothetical protein